MNTRIWWGIIILLFVIIIVLLWILVTTPVPAQQGTIAISTSTPTTSQPLHERVIVDSPQPNTTVGKSFVVTGKAPGNWYFEAVFPVQVRDAANNKIVQAHADALSDWMTTADVPFKVDITVTGYSGPATLVLLRDNPSGLPENDDSVSIPITIQ